MLLSRDQACNWPSSTTTLSTAAVSSSQSLAAALQAAVNKAQAAVNSILTRSPADFASFGPVVQADVAVSNAQNQSPGLVPPGSAIPSAFQFPLGGIPRVQPRRAGAANRGAWGGGRLAQPAAVRVTGDTWPDGSPVNATTKGGPASRPTIANTDAYRARRQSYQMSTGLVPDGVSSGFLGRGETCSDNSAPVDTSPVFASPNPPAPPLTLQGPVSENGVSGRGLAGAYPVSSDSCAAVAGGGEGASVSAGAAAADSGMSPLWWLLAAGVVVWAMAASDQPAKKTYTRRAA